MKKKSKTINTLKEWVTGLRNCTDAHSRLIDVYPKTILIAKPRNLDVSSFSRRFGVMSCNVKYTANANVTVTVEDTGRSELGQSSVTTRLNPSKVTRLHLSEILVENYVRHRSFPVYMLRFTCCSINVFLHLI